MGKKIIDYREGTVELIEYSNCMLLCFRDHETGLLTTVKVSTKEGAHFRDRTGIRPIESYEIANIKDGLENLND